MGCLKTAVRRLSLSLGAEASPYKGLLEIPSFGLHYSLPSVWAELDFCNKSPRGSPSKPRAAILVRR